MPSIKELARCIGLSGDIRIVRDFYGYRTGAPQELSLLTQARLLQESHIHLNLIRVGFDSLPTTPIDEQRAAEEEIDFAVHWMRDVYAAVNIGIGRVERYVIALAEANGREIINDESEAKDLTQEWTVPNDALDVFFVLQILGFAGWSGIDGPCDKNGSYSGSVVAIEHDPDFTGLCLAHEVGHYLGLRHEDEAENLMNASSPAVANRNITASQAQTMRDHCLVNPACSGL
jgi:hypothetical protein